MKTKFSDFAKQVKRLELLEAKKEYPLLGLRLNGKGLFHRETKPGDLISSKSLNCVKTGDFIYSRLFGWRGAFTIVPDKFNGYYVSSEFPIFKIDESQIIKEYLLEYCLLPKTLLEIESLCIGTTKASRNRFKEAKFLNMEIFLPSVQKQKEILDKLKLISKFEDNLKTIISKTANLKQTILQESFSE